MNASSALSRRNGVKSEEQDQASGFVSQSLPGTTEHVKHWDHAYCISTGESEREKLQIEIRRQYIDLKHGYCRQMALQA